MKSTRHFRHRGRSHCDIHTILLVLLLNKIPITFPKNNKFPIKRSTETTNNLQPSKPLHPFYIFRTKPSHTHPNTNSRRTFRIITNTIWHTTPNTHTHFTLKMQRVSSPRQIAWVRRAPKQSIIGRCVCVFVCDTPVWIIFRLKRMLMFHIAPCGAC